MARDEDAADPPVVFRQSHLSLLVTVKARVDLGLTVGLAFGGSVLALLTVLIMRG